MKILANDGLAESGQKILKKAGFEVLATRVAQEQLVKFINDNDISALLVRSATQVPATLMDSCPALKLIGRGGVGMDNIAVAHAKEKGIHVINTPAASSESVAELVFAHLFGGVRFLYDSNRQMPLEGDQHFKSLKKSYSKGSELRGKTLGIIGFGRIGKATAKIALGVGMRVLYHDTELKETTITLEFFDEQKVSFPLVNTEMDKLLTQSDFISLHVPAQQEYVLGRTQFEKIKPGAGIINASRGGVVDEVALIDALESGKVSFAGLDVFESEPSPEIRILMHPKISLSPHIGAATEEAQDRISLELAEQIIRILK